MRRVVSLLFVLTIMAKWASAQQKFDSLEEVWLFAIENNPDNSVYLLRIAKAEKDRKVAASYRYPKVSVGMSGQYNNAIPETPIPGETFGRPGETIYATLGLPYNYSRGFNANWSLLDWQSKYQVKIAQSNIELVKAEKALFEQNLKQQIAQVYFAALTARAAVDLTQKDLALADSILLLSTNRFQQGLTDNLTLNQAKISKNNSLDRLEHNKQYQYQHDTNLKILLGLSPTDSLYLTERIQLNTKFSIESLSTDELSLDLYKLESENSSLARKQARSRSLPKIEVVSFWGSIQYQQNFKLSSSDWQPSQYVRLNFSVPLFTGFSNKNQYQSAKITQNIARINYEEAKRKSSLNDSILLNTAATTEAAVQIAEQNLKLANENVQLAYSKYAEGLINLDSYLSVHKDYLEVENLYFSRLSDYFINKAIIQSRSK
jgi:outer membrane protein TolC